jgi:hypothetical protein
VEGLRRDQGCCGGGGCLRPVVRAFTGVRVPSGFLGLPCSKHSEVGRKRFHRCAAVGHPGLSGSINGSSDVLEVAVRYLAQFLLPTNTVCQRPIKRAVRKNEV